MDVFPLLQEKFLASSFFINDALLLSACKFHFILKFLIFDLLVLRQLFLELVVILNELVVIISLLLLKVLSETSLFFDFFDFSLYLILAVPKEEGLDALSL